MADETMQDDHPDVPPVSVPKPEREPVTIEGEAIDLTPKEEQARESPHGEVEERVVEAKAEPTPEESGSAPPPPIEPVSPASPSRGPAFVSGGVGALLGAAVAFVAAYLYQPGTTDTNGLTTQVSALDSAISAEVSARKTLEARLAGIEAKDSSPAGAPELAARLEKLESAPVTADALAAVAAEAKAAHESANKSAALLASLGPGANGAANPEMSKLIDDQQAMAKKLAELEARLAAAPTAASGAEIGKLANDQQALADRMVKLETTAKPVGPDPEVAKLSDEDKALADRLAKLEAALVAPKTEARADPQVGSKGDPIAQSVAGIALERRLVAGQAYAVELAALERLGSAPDALAALKPFSETGAPSTASLAAGFAKVLPSLGAPAKGAEHGDYVDTIWDEVKGLVKVRQVGEIKGDNPEAVASQIAAALARGDLPAASADFARLPERERAAAAQWAKQLDDVVAARKASLSLIETSLSRLANPKN
jgi:hypothetical protein